MLTRRALVTRAAPALAVAHGLACTAQAPGQLVVSAADDGEGRSSLAIHRPGTDTVRTVPTGVRGHGLASHPARAREVVMFPRRPGRVAVVADVLDARLLHRFEAVPSRQFQGHGVFSPDGGILLVSEEDPATGEGFVGVYETSGYTRQGEWPTHGIEPHELGLLGDGATVVVANGGLRGSGSGTEPTNLDTMDSTLTYLDVSTGRLVEEVRVGEPKASLRHVAITTEGEVVVGIQVQRAGLAHHAPVPLAAVHRRGEPARLLVAPPDVLAELSDYVGSVAVDPGAGLVALTSPRGNLAMFQQLASGRVAGVLRLTDVCGVAASCTGGFVLSASTGAITTVVDPGRPSTVQRLAGVRWDNHLITITPQEEQDL